MKYCMTHGIGDFLQCESFFSEDDRDNFEVMYYMNRGLPCEGLRSLIESCPRFEKVKHAYLDYPTERKTDVENFMFDHGILHRKKFTESSFLKYQLADLPFELPERFDFLHLSTPFNSPGIRATRDITPGEWSAVLGRLEERHTIGLVINSLVEGELPKSDRLIDLRGRTSLPQAVEVLKRATGFLGIDSLFAVLSAQLFKPDDILIRTRNPYVVQACHSYYAPHQEINFLTPEIGKPRYPKATKRRHKKGTLVQLKCNKLVDGRNFTLDDRVELEPEQAEELIRMKLAVPYEV